MNKTFILRPETNATPGITTVFAENNSGGTELGDPPWRLPPNALVRIGSYSLKITYGQELSPAVESTEQEN